MCGRYSASRPPDLTGDLYAAVVVDEPPPPSWNVAPTDPVSCVVRRDDRRELRTLRWGLVPSWSADRKGAARMINARAETVAVKPAFRSALARRRCLVPADGWYEWLTSPEGRKQPFFITPSDRGPLAFAGLYEVWRDPATEELLRTCAVVTTAASESLRYLHERMPVVLPPDAWDEWLDPALDDPLALLQPREGFDAYPVGLAVNSVRNNDPSLVEPIPADGASDEALF
jgi:putative SOS response-associated peptidase YedK